MPYVSQVARFSYKSITDEIKKLEIIGKGDLEYLIFVLMKQYMSDRDYKYSNLHDCVYAAQHCADEFRRRYLDKREDKAMKENGDIV